jgi:hypothetical protein
VWFNAITVHSVAHVGVSAQRAFERDELWSDNRDARDAFIAYPAFAFFARSFVARDGSHVTHGTIFFHFSFFTES